MTNMINNSTIRNSTTSFPAIQGLINNQVLGKILIKNIYQKWQGESIEQIKQKHENNPYSLRIGTPNTDNQLRGDCMYFIPNYLAYNPFTKNIEKRELTDYRNTQTVYIGQSIDEQLYKDYKLFVNGNVVCDDIYLKNTNMSQTPLSQLVISLINKVEKLQAELVEIKRQTKNANIYTQGTI